MLAARYDLIIEQSATFRLELLLKQADGAAFDLSGYIPKAQIRKTYDGELIQEITCTKQSEEDGILLLKIDETNTALLDETEYVYDIILDNETDVIRVLYGKVTVRPDVTREEPIP